MVAFGHTAFGAVIGLAGFEILGQADPISGLAVTGVASFLGHYLEDAIPHGHFFPTRDYKKKIIYVIFLDLGLSIAIFLAKAFFDFGSSLKFLYILIGIAGSQLPDVLDGFVYIGLLKPKGIYRLEHKLHSFVHWHGASNKALLLGIRDFWLIGAVLAALFLI